MTTTSARSVPPSPLDVAVGRVYGEIYGLLNSLPESALDARRAITKQLKIDPTAEELRTIMRLTHDPAGAGVPRELSRSALALRILAGRELEEVFDAPRLSRENLDRATETMPALSKAVYTLEEEMSSRLQAADDEQRDYLVQVRKWLLPSRETLIAAGVLAPKLASFAAAVTVDELRAAHPGLADADAALVASAIAADAAMDECRRSCVNALALRTIIEDDLIELTELRRRGIYEPEVLEPWTVAVQRLERDKIAYDVFAARIQKRQDVALAEGAQDRARRLREAKQQLFSTYLRLVAALKNPASPEEAPPVEAVQAQSERLDQLLEQCASGDAVAEAERGKASKDEVCLDAMKRLRRRAPELTPAMGAAELRRERRRLTLLTSIAATLAVICAGVYAVLLGGRTADPVIPLAELPTSAAVSRAVTVGPMMYTQVSSSVWEGLSEGERLAKVDELGSSAGERGLRTVYVTDESNTDLAHWSRTDGSRLAEPQVE